MKIEDLSRFLESASGVNLLAIMTPNGERVQEVEQLYSPLPFPNYSGIFLATKGVYSWNIYKEGDWRVRIIGPGAG